MTGSKKFNEAINRFSHHTNVSSKYCADVNTGTSGAAGLKNSVTKQGRMEYMLVMGRNMVIG